MNPVIPALGYEPLYPLLARAGIGLPIEIQNNLRAGHVFVDGEPAQAETEVEPGDRVQIGALGYRIDASPNSGHLLVLPADPADAPALPRIRGRRLVQCGYHKCLTMYFRKVFSRTVRNPLTRLGRFTHFFHRLDEFYRRCEEFSIMSISGHAIDLERFDDVLVTRFIRDPRDLLVSGYFYHKRAAESWCDLANPEDGDWQVVNGKVPDALAPGQSLAQYLNAVPLEQGLIAELDFRERHFASMREWPDDDPRMRLFRYEDLVGNEAACYDAMFRFYRFGAVSRFVGRHYARHYRAARRQARSQHIRNASSGQWRQHFTPELERSFNERYGDLVEKLGYGTV